jgi:hypothetical protein
MILVRDVFRLKFGKAREAVAQWKQMGDLAKRSGFLGNPRILTDLVGPYYTLVMETTYDSLAAFDQELKKGMGNPEWHAAYERFTPLVESGYREIFTVVQT